MFTLRSLCMVRVHQLHFPASLLTVKYLPDSLARDVAKARLFQGNYRLRRRNSQHRRIEEVALTISYDGANWIFSHRSQDVIFDCCEGCDYFRPDLVTVIMQEGVAHPTPCVPYQNSNFNLVWLKPHQHCAARSKCTVHAQCCPVPSPDIKLSVEMDKEATVGMLVFKGLDFTKSFEVSNSSQDQQKTLKISNSNSSNSHLTTEQLRRSNIIRLFSVEVNAEMWFPEPQSPSCSPHITDIDSEDSDDDSFQYSSDSDWGVYDPEEDNSEPEEPTPAVQ